MSPVRNSRCTGPAGVREMLFRVPQTGSIGVGLSIMSCNGRLRFGLIADARLIPDPDAVVQRFGAELDKLVCLALMATWDRAVDAPQRVRRPGQGKQPALT